MSRDMWKTWGYKTEVWYLHADNSQIRKFCTMEEVLYVRIQFNTEIPRLEILLAED